MKPRILITGGAGFVGSHLAHCFRRDFPKAEIYCVDNLKRRGSEINVASFGPSKINFVHGDIRFFADLEDLPGNFDFFVEASAEPSVLAGAGGKGIDYLLGTNLIGTQNCLKFAAGRAGRFLFLSTSRVYSVKALKGLPLLESAHRFEIDASSNQPGLSKRGISESFSLADFRSLYGTTKLASELLIQEYAESQGLDAIINRCGVIAGPGQFGKVDQGVFTLWVVNHVMNRPLRYQGFQGKGKQVRDLLHPSDLYELVQKQLWSPLKGADCLFNVGGGHENSISLKEYSQICQTVTGSSVPIESVATTATVDIPYYVSDNSKVQSTYDWKPKRDVAQIVSDIFHWVSSNERTLRTIFSGA